MRTALVIAFLLVICCTGCNEQTQVRATDNEVQVPADPKAAKVYPASRGKLLDYHRFDGIYPADWPRRFDLPEDVYLRQLPLELTSSSNASNQSRGYHYIRFDGIAPISAEELIVHFRGELRDCGFELSKDTDRTGTIEPKYDYQWLFGTKFQPRSRIAFINIAIDFREDLDGWTEYSGSVIVNTNY